MYVYDANHVDFVLCTKHAIFIERVGRDEEFIMNMVSRLEDFADNVFFPEIVNPQVKFGNPPVDLRLQKN